MRQASRTALALLAIVILAATGCTGPKTAMPVTPVITATATVEPTASAPATAGPAVSPVTTPKAGSSTRAAILEAVSVGLGISGRLTVYQLFAQGGAAVGDVLPAGGSRTLFAVTGGPDAWKLVWSAPFGSGRASTGALTKSDPESLDWLASSLDFTKKAPQAAPKPAAAPTLASFKAFALASATSFAGATYTGKFTLRAKIVKDSHGGWWGNAMAEPSEEGLEPIGIWGSYSKGRWRGEIADLSQEGADAGFFPADVLAKLAL